MKGYITVQRIGAHRDGSAKTSKVEQAVRSHPLVDEISDERDLDSGIWVYLKHGYCNGEAGTHHTAEGCVHSIHEDTWSACQKQLPLIAKCIEDY